MEPTSDNGIISLPSHHSLDETVDRLKGILHAKGVTLFAIIDHSGEAEKAGMKMPSTKLLIFGSPKSGTPREDAARKVWVSYNNPSYLVKRHGLPPELISNIAAIEGLAAQTGL